MPKTPKRVLFAARTHTTGLLVKTYRSVVLQQYGFDSRLVLAVKG